jgi:hypothetical protein
LQKESGEIKRQEQRPSYTPRDIKDLREVHIVTGRRREKDPHIREERKSYTHMCMSIDRETLKRSAE